ncbi:MAG: hypothetical protein AAF663_07800 [Planctomycetota bacterium]
MVEPVPGVTLSPDAGDNPIIATAIAGRADWIVTGNEKDFADVYRATGNRYSQSRTAWAVNSLPLPLRMCSDTKWNRKLGDAKSIPLRHR